MRKLFEIGLNDGGFYVFPYTSPPHFQAQGDEIGLAQAIELRDSLNHNVATYISQLVVGEPTELLREMTKHWSWHHILGFISDLIWHEYRNTEGITPQSRLLQNWRALGCIVENWSK